MVILLFHVSNFYFWFSYNFVVLFCSPFHINCVPRTVTFCFSKKRNSPGNFRSSVLVVFFSKIWDKIAKCKSPGCSTVFCFSFSIFLLHFQFNIYKKDHGKGRGNGNEWVHNTIVEWYQVKMGSKRSRKSEKS